jgi:hypothetical protein
VVQTASNMDGYRTWATTKARQPAARRISAPLGDQRLALAVLGDVSPMATMQQRDRPTPWGTPKCPSPSEKADPGALVHS